MTDLDNATKQSILNRRDATLARWWHELNIFGWPKEIPDPEERELLGTNPRRDAVMNFILHVLGTRTMHRLRKEANDRS